MVLYGEIGGHAFRAFSLISTDALLGVKSKVNGGHLENRVVVSKNRQQSGDVLL